MSTPYETFRATLPTSTPDGERATVIITRQGQGVDARVWVTFSGAWATTAVMTDADAERSVSSDSSVTRERHAGEADADLRASAGPPTPCDGRGWPGWEPPGVPDAGWYRGCCAACDARGGGLRSEMTGLARWVRA
jgi:hypothetical protein